MPKFDGDFLLAMKVCPSIQVRLSLSLRLSLAILYAHISPVDKKRLFNRIEKFNHGNRLNEHPFCTPTLVITLILNFCTN